MREEGRGSRDTVRRKNGRVQESRQACRESKEERQKGRENSWKGGRLV